MFPTTQSLTYKQTLWFIPILLLVHNIEEALTMPQWVEVNLSVLREKLFLFRYVNFSRVQLYTSLVLVSLIPFILATFCMREPMKTKRITVLLALQGIIFWNAFVPHLSGIFVLGMYNPGTITAMVINIPFSIYLFRRSVKEGMFTAKNLRSMMLLALAVYLPVVYLNHLLAEWIVSIL